MNNANAHSSYEALSCIEQGVNKMLYLSDVFTAFQELFSINCGTDKGLSAEAREGLVYLFKLLADDAGNIYEPLYEAYEVLKTQKVEMDV